MSFLRKFFLIFLESVLQVVKKKSTIMQVCASRSKLSFSSLPSTTCLAGESKQLARTEKTAWDFWDSTVSHWERENAWKLEGLYCLCSSFTITHAPILSLLVKILQLFGFAYSISCIQGPGTCILLERIYFIFSKLQHCLKNVDSGKKISSTYSFQEY